MRRLPLILVLLIVLAGCAGEPQPPTVTFSAGGETVTARPTQYCDVEFRQCRNDAEAPVTLPVPAGATVRIAVPPEIASTPWLVVFTTLSTDGTRTDGRTALFTARDSYELTLPAPTDRLLTAQVQQLGAPPEANEESGGVDFPARATWVLTTTL